MGTAQSKVRREKNYRQGVYLNAYKRPLISSLLVCITLLLYTSYCGQRTQKLIGICFIQGIFTTPNLL